mmetsp:Transcript_30498/g.59571  ORF Transcript_30498/g.59571 Transcript_30498/m.59571 type:complete len:219 (-) Transcript_30498:520-1176(-)
MLSKILVAGLTGLAAFGGADAFSTGSTLPARAATRAATCSLSMQQGKDEGEKGLDTRRAVVGGLFSLMIGAQTLIPTEAEAAKSGGRVGGGFKKMSSSRSAPSKTAVGAAAAPTTVVRPTTVNVINTAPAYGGGYGYGGGFGYGGFGPPLSPGVWVGLGAIELAETFAREQRRQEAYKRELETQRKLGQDQAAIESLEKQLAQQNMMMMQMQQQMNNK